MMTEESAEARVQVMAASRFRRICVFCGSSKGKKTSYQDAAVELGKELVRTHLLSFSIAAGIISPLYLVSLNLLFSKVTADSLNFRNSS
jgi:hypothetical protein